MFVLSEAYDCMKQSTETLWKTYKMKKLNEFKKFAVKNLHSIHGGLIYSGVDSRTGKSDTYNWTPREIASGSTMNDVDNLTWR